MNNISINCQVTATESHRSATLLEQHRTCFKILWLPNFHSIAFHSLSRHKLLLLLLCGVFFGVNNRDDQQQRKLFLFLFGEGRNKWERESYTKQHKESRGRVGLGLVVICLFACLFCLRRLKLGRTNCGGCCSVLP